MVNKKGDPKLVQYNNQLRAALFIVGSFNYLSSIFLLFLKINHFEKT